VVLVLAKAMAANEDTLTAEPAVKPNQPNHRNPVPKSANGMLAGGNTLDSTFDFWGFRKIAPARAAQPDDICTTVPPAKSCAPIWKK